MSKSWTSCQNICFVILHTLSIFPSPSFKKEKKKEKKKEIRLQRGVYLDLLPGTYRKDYLQLEDTSWTVNQCYKWSRQRKLKRSGGWNSCADKTSPTPNLIRQTERFATGNTSGLLFPVTLLSYKQRVIHLCQRDIPGTRSPSQSLSFQCLPDIDTIK